jgi:peptide/nickel transport system substrate-binding protein
MDVQNNGRSREGDATPRYTRELSRRALLRGAAAGGAALAMPGLLAAAGTQVAAAAGPKRGGRLRVGMIGGGSSESLNPYQSPNEIDLARNHCNYELLTDFSPDGTIYNRLAAEFSHNVDGTIWKIKVRPGVTWHDGSPFVADDVTYSLQYIMNPKNNAQGITDLASMALKEVRSLDPTTVELRLSAPRATLPTSFTSRAIYMVKHGTTTFDKPVGTGPWKFVSWTRGERSLFARYDGYRQHGGPYLDELEMISINDPTTRLTSLEAGQIDALGYLDPKLISAVVSNPNLRLLNHVSGGYTCQFMQVDKAPFTDNRVRQAFRYLVDREALVKGALLGYGKLGNDLACWFDADYAREIPQRPYDPEKAKFLLKQAGQTNLTVSLYTSEVAPGMLESSLLIAQQAKKVGVTVTIDKAPADQYWTNKYLKVPFECTQWGPRPLDVQMAQGLNPKLGNETDWYRPDFNKLCDAARRTLDAKQRHELWVAAQRMLWNEGGYLIWGFLNYVDATSAKVHGLVPSAMRSLGWYTFTDTYFA